MLSPIAVEEAPTASVSFPIAVEEVPLAVVFSPIAVEEIPLAVVLSPIAVEIFPLAVVLCPIAIDRFPLAVLPEDCIPVNEVVLNKNGNIPFIKVFNPSIVIFFVTSVGVPLV